MGLQRHLYSTPEKPAYVPMRLKALYAPLRFNILNVKTARSADLRKVAIKAPRLKQALELHMLIYRRTTVPRPNASNMLQSKVVAKADVLSFTTLLSANNR